MGLSLQKSKGEHCRQAEDFNQLESSYSNATTLKIEFRRSSRHRVRQIKNRSYLRGGRLVGFFITPGAVS